MVEGPRTRALAAGEVLHAGGRNKSAWVPHFGVIGVPEGRKGRAEIVAVQAGKGRFLLWGGVLPVRGEEVRGRKPTESLPPLVTSQDTGQGPARAVNLGGGGAVPTGRPGCRPQTRGLLGV